MLRNESYYRIFVLGIFYLFLCCPRLFADSFPVELVESAQDRIHAAAEMEEAFLTEYPADKEAVRTALEEEGAGISNRVILNPSAEFRPSTAEVLSINSMKNLIPVRSFVAPRMTVLHRSLFVPQDDGLSVSESISDFERLDLEILAKALRVNESISFVPAEENVPVPDVLFVDVLKFFSPDNRRKSSYREDAEHAKGCGSFGHFLGPGMLYPCDLQISSFMLQDFHFTGVSDKERRYFALHNTSPPYFKQKRKNLC